MSWREELIEVHKKEIEQMRRSVVHMESGKLKLRGSSGGGPMIDLTDQSIEHYKRTIAELEQLIARMESDVSGEA